jgi:hypothetical protein
MDPRLNQTLKSYITYNNIKTKENRNKSPELISKLNKKFQRVTQNRITKQSVRLITRKQI